MPYTKRAFLKTGLAGAGALALGTSLALPARRVAAAPTPAFEPIAPISVAERQARVARAQALMQEAKVGALLLEPGASMLYFSGIQWWRSERLTAVVIPAEGAMAVVTPYFEEPSVRQSLAFGDDVRTWNENENPFERVLGILSDRGALGKSLALEETVRYFVVSSLKALKPGLEMVSGDRITLGCRMFKSEHELSLMQRANDITLAAYRAVYPQITTGMSREDIASIMASETARLGGSPGFQLVLLGEASAYPHGSGQPQQVREGEVVLMDCGCAYQGYQSDISRSFVFGEPSARQRQVWDTVRRGQQMAFESARPGMPAGQVDAVVRKWYESLGYGPGYKTPGTPHRLGHGIGMEGHERINLVGGEQAVLQPGMCFSNEPGIYIYGEFGIRLEDCMYITESGPRWFTEPPASLDDPIG